jgi:signal recognition particle receptor subunit beta
MAVVDQASRTIHCKIAYFGPGMAGKTSCLQAIHQTMPADRRSNLLSVATADARAFFFHCDPPDTPLVRGCNVRFYLQAVPGAVLYQRTRIAILRGADGIVFVADSQRIKLQDNIKSLQEMVRTVYANSRSLDDTPVVLQYSKRDMPNILPAEVMDKYLNPLGWPRFESTLWWRDGSYQMRRTVGVLEAFQAVRERVIARLG